MAKKATPVVPSKSASKADLRALIADFEKDFSAYKVRLGSFRTLGRAWTVD